MSGGSVDSGCPARFRDIHAKPKRVFDARGPTWMFWGTDITLMPCPY